MKRVVAIYARLSREDEDKIDGNKESRSIDNQIKSLSIYAKEHDMEIYRIYYDDGFTGANQDRPDFQQLLKDCYAHKFNTLLIKDISRLGRVMHQVGQLIEQTFPENNIRVISLNDNYDSDNYSDTESIVLRNFLNSYYLKDFKRKHRKVLEYRSRTKHLNYYPKYGYCFDSERNEHIDPYSSAIVEKIFQYVADGKTTPEVARLLNEAGILTRSRYATEVLGMKPLNKTPAKEWNGEKVWEIVKDYEYCGHSLNLVRHEEPPILIRNTHYAIISEELFKKANDMIMTRNTRPKGVRHLGKILLDLKTGQRLSFITGRNKVKEDYYYSKKGKYSIKLKTLHSLLYQSAIELIESCVNNGTVVKDLYKKRIFKARESNKEELTFKLNSLNEEYSRLMEEYFNGRVPQLKFDKKSSDLVTRIKNIESQLAEFNQYEAQIIIYERKFKRFLETIKTVPENDLDLIEIVIAKVYFAKPEGQKELDITIVYKFEEL